MSEMKSWKSTEMAIALISQKKTAGMFNGRALHETKPPSEKELIKAYAGNAYITKYVTAFSKT